MQTTFTTIVTEMVSAEKTRAPGPEKHALVVTALQAAGWVDDTNRAEVERYIDLVIWIAKRPEVRSRLLRSNVAARAEKILARPYFRQ